MTTPAENDALLSRWVTAERVAIQAEAQVQAASRGPANLPIPAPSNALVEAAAQARQAATFARTHFMQRNGVMRGFGPVVPLSPSTEFRRLIMLSVKMGYPNGVLDGLQEAYAKAVTAETGHPPPTRPRPPPLGPQAPPAPLPTGTTAPTAPAAATATSTGKLVFAAAIGLGLFLVLRRA